MVKTQKTKFLEFPKSLWNFKLFSKDFSLKHLIYYDALIYVILMFLVLILNDSSRIIPRSIMDVFTIAFLGILIYVFIIYGLFFMFLTAFEGKKLKPFFESFFVFLALIFPFFLIFHVLNIFQKTFWSSTIISLFTQLIVFLLFFYMIINIILNLKNYYKNNGYRIVASFVLTLLVLITLSIMMFVITIFGNL